MNSVYATLTRALQDDKSRACYVFSDIVAVLIILSTGVLIFESVASFQQTYKTFFLVAEIVFTVTFAIEYTLRLAFVENKIRYVTSPFGIIDALAFLPGILYLFTLPVPLDYRILRVFRVVRIVRLFRSLRMSRLFMANEQGSYRTRKTLQGIRLFDIEVYFLSLFTIAIISGSLVYWAESGAPNANITNIPEGLWWSIVTLTTTGFGDFVPVTVLGKIVGAFTMVAGLGLFAILIAVMSKSMQTFLFGTLIEEEERLEQKMAEEERKEQKRQERRAARKKTTKKATTNGSSNSNKK